MKNYIVFISILLLLFGCSTNKELPIKTVANLIDNYQIEEALNQIKIIENQNLIVEIQDFDLKIWKLQCYLLLSNFKEAEKLFLENEIKWPINSNLNSNALVVYQYYPVYMQLATKFKNLPNAQEYWLKFMESDIKFINSLKKISLNEYNDYTKISTNSKIEVDINYLAIMEIMQNEKNEIFDRNEYNDLSNSIFLNMLKTQNQIFIVYSLSMMLDYKFKDDGYAFDNIWSEKISKSFFLKLKEYLDLDEIFKEIKAKVYRNELPESLVNLMKELQPES